MMKKRVAIFISAFSAAAVIVIISLVLVAYFHEWGVFDRGDGFKEETQQALTKETYDGYIAATINRLNNSDNKSNDFYQVSELIAGTGTAQTGYRLRFFENRFEQEKYEGTKTQTDYFAYYTVESRYLYRYDDKLKKYDKTTISVEQFRDASRITLYRDFLTGLKDCYDYLAFDDEAVINRVPDEHLPLFIEKSGLSLFFGAAVKNVTLEFNAGRLYRVTADVTSGEATLKGTLTYTFRMGKSYEVRLPDAV